MIFEDRRVLIPHFTCNDPSCEYNLYFNEFEREMSKGLFVCYVGRGVHVYPGLQEINSSFSHGISIDGSKEFNDSDIYGRFSLFYPGLMIQNETEQIFIKSPTSASISSLNESFNRKIVEKHGFPGILGPLNKEVVVRVVLTMQGISYIFKMRLESMSFRGNTYD